VSPRAVGPATAGWARQLTRVVAAAGFAFSCTSAVEAPPPKAPAAEPAKATARVAPLIVSPEEAGSADLLLQRAKLDFERGAFEAAATRLSRVVEAEPNGPSTPEALYYLALSQEGQRQHEDAATTFTTLYAAHASAPMAQEAAVRASRLWVYLERYDAADDAALAALQLDEAKLAPLDRVALLSARALNAMAQGDLAKAEYHEGKGRSIVEAANLDVGGLIARDVAQLYFALGESRRLRSEGLRFDAVGEQFAMRFELRASGLLEAQRAYADAMRAEDAHWTARAGTRVGEMYDALHRDVMVTPLPKAALDAKRGKLFEGAMRLRYVVLLQKGLVMVENTVAMVDRTHETSVWAERARELKTRLTQRLADENRAIDALPYTRQSLQDVLDELQRRKQDPAPAPPSGAP
jgi:tetratricopeptide (TPR) repeat protein